MRRIRLGLALLCLGLTQASFGAEFPLHIVHASGSSTLESQPQRILVFDLGVLDTLDALAVPVAGVPDWPLAERHARAARIGSLFEPDYAAVQAARPDLIIVGKRSRAHYASLSALAPTLDLSATAADPYADVAHNARQLARVFGREAQAEALLARLANRLTQVEAAARQAGTVQILIASGGQLSAIAPGTGFGQLYRQFGLQPAAPKLQAPAKGLPLSPAQISALEADWLWLIDRDAAVGQGTPSGRALLDEPELARSKALRAGRLIELDARLLYLSSLGLASEQALAQSMLQALCAHPATASPSCPALP